MYTSLIWSMLIALKISLMSIIWKVTMCYWCEWKKRFGRRERCYIFVLEPRQNFDFPQSPLAVGLMFEGWNLFDGDLCLCLIVVRGTAKSARDWWRFFERERQFLLAGLKAIVSVWLTHHKDTFHCLRFFIYVMVSNTFPHLIHSKNFIQE